MKNIALTYHDSSFELYLSLQVYLNDKSGHVVLDF